MMKIKLCFVFLLIEVVLTSATFFPGNYLTIVEKQGFLAYFIPALDVGPLRSCNVTISGVSYDFDPTTVTSSQHKLPSGTEIARFSQKTCGVRVKNLDKSVDSNWVFEVVDERGRSETGTLTVIALVPELEPSVQNITAIVDDTLKNIQCPNSYGARYCHMYNRYGEQYLNTCEKSTTLTIDQNQWTCQVYRWGNMQSYDGTVYIHMEERKKDAIAEMYETDTHVVFSCTNAKSVSHCRAEMPGKLKQLMIMDGLLTDHYSSYDTDITNGRCVIEIEKPLRPEDIGTWRFLYYFYTNDESNLGCVFDVGGNASKAADREITRWPRSNQNNPTSVEVLGNVPTTTVITCEVPYEIAYCYLEPPASDDINLMHYEYEPINFKNSKYLGQCLFKVANITSGQWVCGINDQYNGEDILTYYQVTVYEKPAQVVSERLEARRGDGVKLMCKSVMNQPMNYCRFTTPAGQIHGLSQNTRNIPGSRYHYYGTGLADGECGIEIDDLQSSDFGNWVCTFQIATKEYKLRMDLERAAMSLAASWGLGIGLAIIVMLGAGFVGHRYFVRQKNQHQSSDVRNNNILQQRRQSLSDVSISTQSSYSRDLVTVIK